VLSSRNIALLGGFQLIIGFIEISNPDILRCNGFDVIDNLESKQNDF